MEVIFLKNIPALQVNSYLFLNFDYKGCLNITKDIDNNIAIKKSAPDFIKAIYNNSQSLPLILEAYLYNNLPRDVFLEILDNLAIINMFLSKSLKFFYKQHKFNSIV